MQEKQQMRFFFKAITVICLIIGKLVPQLVRLLSISETSIHGAR